MVAAAATALRFKKCGAVTAMAPTALHSGKCRTVPVVGETATVLHIRPVGLTVLHMRTVPVRTVPTAHGGDGPTFPLHPICRAVAAVIVAKDLLLMAATVLHFLASQYVGPSLLWSCRQVEPREVEGKSV